MEPETGGLFAKPKIGALRLVVIVLGYATGVFGFLSTFRIPLPWPLVIGLAGMLAALAVTGRKHAHTLPRGKWLLLVMLSGPLLMLAVLSRFSDLEMMHWTPHPAGFFSAWYPLIFGLAHVWRIRREGRRPD
jgi:hypothetical protein